MVVGLRLIRIQKMKQEKQKEREGERVGFFFFLVDLLNS